MQGCPVPFYHISIIFGGYVIQTLFMLVLSWKFLKAHHLEDTDSAACEPLPPAPFGRAVKEAQKYVPSDQELSEIKISVQVPASTDVIAAEGSLVHHHILSYLDATSLAKCECASKVWYKAANTESLWKAFSTDPRKWITPPPMIHKVVQHIQFVISCVVIAQVVIQFAVDIWRMVEYMRFKSDWENYICYAKIVASSSNYKTGMIMSVWWLICVDELEDMRQEPFITRILAFVVSVTYCIYMLLIFPILYSHGIAALILFIWIPVTVMIAFAILASPCLIMECLKRKVPMLMEYLMIALFISLFHFTCYVGLMLITLMYEDLGYVGALKHAVRFGMGLGYFENILENNFDFMSFWGMLL